MAQFNNDDILVLAKAGFTAEQIAALNAIQNAPAPEPQPEPTPEPAPQPEPTPETAPQPEVKAEPPKQGATIDDVLGAISGLTKTFQAGFLQSAEQPKPVTAESILAEIINPPTVKKEE